MTETKLVFYGVRGSYPVPNPKTCKYGGNTSSILIERDDKAVILDAGTGIINIGNYLKSEKKHIRTVDLFLTHLHIDHIHGIPFFEPVFDSQFKINIYCDESQKGSLQDTIYSLFDQPLSPISKKGIKADIRFVHLDARKPETIPLGDHLRIDYIKEFGHPLSGVLIYRVNAGDFKVVYATDIESPDGFQGNYFDFVKGSDILIHDSQYFEDDYDSPDSPKKGFGHSTVTMAAANAVKCGVGKLFLFHYSPGYSDEDVERMLKEARKIFKETYLSEELKKITLRR